MTNSGIVEQSTYWERAAQSRWGAYISEIEKNAILHAHALAGEPSRALEIGCEGGRWSKLLSDLGWTITCTDVDAQSLRLCQGRLPDAVCILVEPESQQLPCKANAVRLLLCIEVPPVVKSSWFPQESHRVLAPGGLIVGVFFNLISWRGLAAHLTAPIRGSYDFFELSYKAWKRNFCRTGYSIVQEKGFCWFPFRRTSNSGLIPRSVWMERHFGLQNLPDLSPWIIFTARKHET